MKRTLKDRISLLGLNYSKELFIIFLIIIVSVGGALSIYFFLEQLFVSILLLLAGLFLTYFYLSRYSNLEKALEDEHINELISLLNYFEIFISNKNNVYMSFKFLLPYCSPFMDEAINSLLNQMDLDKTIGPYISFANKFNSRIIDSLMMSIYQIVDNGNQENQFSEFELLFSNVRTARQEDLIDRKKKSLDSLNSLPMIGAAGITISLSISIISVIGDYVNVI